MKWLKRLWQMTGDKRWTCRLIAIGCVPLTLFDVLFVSPSPECSAAMVGLNGLMILIAATEGKDED